MREQQVQVHMADDADSIESRLVQYSEPKSRVPTVTVVVPCYNEEEVIAETASRLGDILQDLVDTGAARDRCCIFFIDDGSSDATWPLIEGLAVVDSRCHGIKLSRNHGHQNALLAGLLNVPGDVVISVDADLQDDVSAIRDMISAYADGAEIVFGVRRKRQADSIFKRISAESYYRMLQAMGVNVVFNHADFRLLSRRVIEALREYKETNLFLRGLIPQLGFKTASVFYDRSRRFAGESKYPFPKMLRLALEGITSFSALPLKLITILGLLVSVLSFAAGLWAVWVRIFNPEAVPGWASTVIPIYMLGGIQLLSVGIIGQYLAKVYLESKARPRFIIDKML